MIISNDRSIGEIETEIKIKAGIDGDVEFHEFGDRKIQTGEMIFEHQTIKLM
jgi:hypothetical protein